MLGSEKKPNDGGYALNYSLNRDYDDTYDDTVLNDSPDYEPSVARHSEGEGAW